MEERFQRYRGKVRLLYTYVREAHPNPARAPCGATEDLGWEHASGNTRTRAERARWLGKDRNLDFPWIIDNQTGDPTYIEPIVNTFQADVSMPGAANIRGAHSSHWVTDMVISNLEEVEVTATVELFERDGGGAAVDTIDLAIAPGQSLLIRDALTTLFSSEGAATLAIHGSRGLMAVGRTYNDTPSGTFGQLVPGVDISADGVLRRGTVGHLL